MAVNTLASRRPRLALYLDLIRWDRPQGWLLLLWPTLTALWLAAHLAAASASAAWPGWHLLFVFVVGTVLMRSAGCAVNDVADRDFDRHVKRTAARPVTSGALPVKEALAVAAVLALLAFALVLSTNLPTVLLSFPALAVTIVYPYTKRFFSMPQAVLGLAFSFGIPMAFTAVLGRHEDLAWLLVAANLFWVLAYDTEYAMVDRDDDLNIGIRTSAITFGRFDVAAVATCYALHLGLMAWAAQRLGLGAGFALGWLAALGQMLWHLALIRHRSREGCFRAFRANHWVGAALFAGVLLDPWLAVGTALG